MDKNEVKNCCIANHLDHVQRGASNCHRQKNKFSPVNQVFG